MVLDGSHALVDVGRLRREVVVLTLLLLVHGAVVLQVLGKLGTDRGKLNLDLSDGNTRGLLRLHALLEESILLDVHIDKLLLEVSEGGVILAGGHLVSRLGIGCRGPPGGRWESLLGEVGLQHQAPDS